MEKIMQILGQFENSVNTTDRITEKENGKVSP